MTHMNPMPESAGTFTKESVVQTFCRREQAMLDHRVQVWESNDGAYEDYKYTCLSCGTVHWVDGIDS
jgi:hypothetical protein